MPPLESPAIDTRAAHSLDGTRIAYRRWLPPAAEGAPAIVLAGGFGTSDAAFRPLIEHLRDRFRIVTWDRRGLYGSARPASGGASAYAVERQVDDLIATLDAEGIPRASVIGWSRGARVALEAARRAPHRVENLVLLSPRGCAPHEPGRLGALGASVEPWALDLARALHPVLTAAARGWAKSRAFAPLLRWTRVVGPTLADDALVDLGQSLSRLDLEPVLLSLRSEAPAARRHSLRALTMPVLLVAGDRDRSSPPGRVFTLARALPSAEVLVVPGGTHYAAAEFPDLVLLRVERFYRACGFVPTGEATSPR